jgi:hypothetical protein
MLEIFQLPPHRGILLPLAKSTVQPMPDPAVYPPYVDTALDTNLDKFMDTVVSISLLSYSYR